MQLFKSKLRARIEAEITKHRIAVVSLEKEIAVKRITQTLNPAEYAKYSVLISDMNGKIRMLENLLYGTT